MGRGRGRRSRKLDTMCQLVGFGTASHSCQDLRKDRNVNSSTIPLVEKILKLAPSSTLYALLGFDTLMVGVLRETPQSLAATRILMPQAAYRRGEVARWSASFLHGKSSAGKTTGAGSAECPEKVIEPCRREKVCLEKFCLLAQQIILIPQRAIKSTHMRTSLWTQHSPYSAYQSRGNSSTFASRSLEMTSAG